MTRAHPSVKRLALAGLGLAAVAAVAVAATGGGLGPRSSERFKTHTVAKGPLTQMVSANGTLNPVSLVSVGTQVSGTVKKLYVDFNSQVEAGQPLLELDDALYAAQARQSAAAVEAASVALELAQANEARVQTLHAQGYASTQELDQTLFARRAAQAQLALAKAVREKDAVNLASTVIRSPVSGVVVDRVVDVGQTVAASFQTPTLIRIAQDLSKMQIDAAFAEADIGLVHVGQAVRFAVDAFPSRTFQGQVKQLRLSPTTVQNVVTYDVVVAVDNADQLLLPGMTAYVTIGVANKDDALLVPNAALRFRPARSDESKDKATEASRGGRPEEKKGRKGGASGMVHVLSGGNLRPVAVSLGISDHRMTEVAGGELQAGDVVVVGEKGAAEGAPAAGSPSPMRVRLF